MFLIDWWKEYFYSGEDIPPSKKLIFWTIYSWLAITYIIMYIVDIIALHLGIDTKFSFSEITRRYLSYMILGLPMTLLWTFIISYYSFSKSKSNKKQERKKQKAFKALKKYIDLKTNYLADADDNQKAIYENIEHRCYGMKTIKFDF